MKRTPLRRKTPLKAKKPKPDIKELLESGKVKRASSLSRKPMRKRSPRQKGWIDIAYEILEERGPHCEVCGAFIADPGPINFSHLLTRSTYPDYKRDKRNLVIKDAHCHELWHKHGPKNLQWSFQWKKVCELYFDLYEEANKNQ